MRGKKGTGTSKARVRFCRLDYYRYLCTGEPSRILGIDRYFADENKMTVFYSSGETRIYKLNEGEKQLKDVIKIINNYIGGRGDGTQQQFA